VERAVSRAGGPVMRGRKAGGRHAGGLPRAGWRPCSQPTNFIEGGGGGAGEAGTSVGPAGHPGEKADRQTDGQTGDRWKWAVAALQ
jgi:hypothetical protein